MRPLVVLRPEPGNSATAATARALGCTVHAAPLFAMAARPWQALDAPQYAALLAGSANAFRLGGPGLSAVQTLPVHAVGEATAAAARAAGFTVAATGEGGLQPLVSALPPGRYLRLAGEKRVPLAMPDGVEVDDCVVYAAAPLPLPEAVQPALRDAAVVLLHSAEAAAHFAAECERLAIARAPLALACLAPRIAEAAGKGWQMLEVPSKRSDEALLAMAAAMCQRL